MPTVQLVSGAKRVAGVVGYECYDSIGGSTRYVPATDVDHDIKFRYIESLATPKVDWADMATAAPAINLAGDTETALGRDVNARLLTATLDALSDEKMFAVAYPVASMVYTTEEWDAYSEV